MNGSSNKTIQVWVTEIGKCKQVLEGHNVEIFSFVYNYEGDTIITISKENSCRVLKNKKISLIIKN